MIIVPIKEGENIERALKKFKRKFEKTGVVKELRSRQAFQKPSERRRDTRSWCTEHANGEQRNGNSSKLFYFDNNSS